MKHYLNYDIEIVLNTVHRSAGIGVICSGVGAALIIETIRGSCSSRAPMKNILKIIIYGHDSVTMIGFCKT